MSERDSTPLFGGYFCFGLEENGFREGVTRGYVDATVMWWFDNFNDLAGLETYVRPVVIPILSN